MSQNPQEEPFSEASLDSPEYRERLIRKLNCLIAVLEVATAKVRKTLATSTGDTERLVRIRTNLQSTLDVCLRARAALERREALPKELPANLTQVIQDTSKERADEQPEQAANEKRRSDARTGSEMRKFERMGPIDRRLVESCDIEELTRKLQS
jgi:hypothetical protein